MKDFIPQFDHNKSRKFTVDIPTATLILFHCVYPFQLSLFFYDLIIHVKRRKVLGKNPKIHINQWYVVRFYYYSSIS